MDIRPIRTEADLDWALKEIEQYFDTVPKTGTPEGNRFEVLSTLIEAYEDRHYPIPPLDPAGFLESFIEMTGRSRSDLVELAGSESLADDILAGRGGMTIELAYLLKARWNVPADILLESGRNAA